MLQWVGKQSIMELIYPLSMISYHFIFASEQYNRKEERLSQHFGHLLEICELENLTVDVDGGGSWAHNLVHVAHPPVFKVTF